MNLGGGSIAITSILALSTSIPLLEFSLPKTISVLLWSDIFPNSESSSSLCIFEELTLSNEDTSQMNLHNEKNHPWKFLEMFYHIGEKTKHAPFKCRGSIAQSKEHVSVGEGFEWTGERSLLLVFYSNGDLVVSWVPIQETKVLMSSQAFKYLVDER